MATGKHILVTGGTGFIGSRLCPALVAAGYDVHVLTRDPARWRQQALAPQIHYVAALEELDRDTGWCGVVNLAGESLAQGRWDSRRKQVLRSSRIDTTDALVRWLAGLSWPAPPLVSGSAIGWYGHRGDEVLDENSTADGTAGGHFAHTLCADWEAAAATAHRLGSRVCLLRTGIVLGAEGGPLAAMLPPARLGAGGPMGNGRQWWSWIHIDDLVALVLFLLHTEGAEGPINGTAPNPVTQREFARALGRQLRRPAVAPMPAFAARLLLGEFADEILLHGQRVLPTVATALGFRFRFPELGGALADLLG